ncbi:Peptidase M16 inactive domain protein [Limihaloglobus sulfuriphilus]|uniref:Peptidase M16 inactive domain protein n=1 Tax=Limihaloglobus sulfuriphilus TaxID=1851148 RepID=A0A1R7T689_9BACT|nr:pitrilysin family protein [Limihaloglobus sulfuriphilus]AQQ72513.1 Peptidase M16 inactive domain protein [Limihaloglobus sulfuriphilus]
MNEKIDSYTLKNGMKVFGEHMEVGSVSFNIMLPCGTSRIPQGCSGAGNVISDWVFRGAGEYTSRRLVENLDGLGLHRGSGVGTYCMNFSSALEASNLLRAIELYADVVLRPKLDAGQFELSRQLALSDLAGLDDDPRQQVVLKLKENFYGRPWGRSSYGSKEDLESLNPEKTASIIKDRFKPSKAIFSIAGKYDFDAVCKKLEELFGDSEPDCETQMQESNPSPAYDHISHDGSQVHIGIMCSTVPASDAQYYNLMAAVSVLSGGMSSRLFTEVREKRGLCYAVGANYNSLRDRAGIVCYAGTTPDKAQQTYDVTRKELNRLKEDLTAEELQRAKIGLKSGLIMKSESSMNRAGSIGGDYNLLGRVRSLDEIKENIEAVTIESMTAALEANPFDKCKVVTIGPKEIKV